MVDDRQSITIIDALQALKPKSEWHLSGDKLKWLDPNQPHPSQADIDNKIAELQAEYDAKQYQRDRNYPDIGEQLDLLYHDMTSGKNDKTGEWYKAISKVKTDNPKSS